VQKQISSSVLKEKELKDNKNFLSEAILCEDDIKNETHMKVLTGFLKDLKV